MAGIVDANAAGLAAGVVGSGDGVIVMGTSTVLLMGSDRWVECGNLAEIYHALPGGTVVFGAMSTTGASLKWFRDQFADTEKQLARERGADVYDVLTAEAAEAPAGSGNLVFLPYLMGERAPVWDSAARGTFFGLTLHTTRADVIRAILEGVAFGVYHNVQEARTLGLQLSRLMAVGGGNSRLVVPDHGLDAQYADFDSSQFQRRAVRCCHPGRCGGGPDRRFAGVHPRDPGGGGDD